MKYYKYLAFLVISFLLTLGCGKDSPQNGPVNESIAQVESHDKLLKEVSKEAFVKSKEIEPIGQDSDKKSPIEETSKEKITEEKKASQSNEEAKKKEVQKSAKKRKPSKRPQITFDSIVHHLPTITRGETFAHEFKFKNTGDAPLSILLAVPSCGCTLPSYPFLDIPPDSSGVIGLEYNSVGKHGRQEAEITITANTRPKETVLTMVFDVEEPEEEGKVKKDTLSN